MRHFLPHMPHMPVVLTNATHDESASDLPIKLKGIITSYAGSVKMHTTPVSDYLVGAIQWLDSLRRK